MKTLKISIILTFFSLLTCIALQMMQPATPATPATPAAPTVKKSHCEIVQITITTPAGYTVGEAIKSGKILEIVW